MAENVSKLAIGTANFGLDYGLNNLSGKLSELQLRSILESARTAGVEVFDTAQAYGDSEERLGKFVNSGDKVITKTGVGLDDKYQKGAVLSSVQLSAEHLKAKPLYGVLLHRPELLLGTHGDEILEELMLLKQQNVVGKIGVSIYAPEILEELLEVFEPEIVQTPFNIFDQRLLTSGWADRLKSIGTEIHVRSSFLQGLLLMNECTLPEPFSRRWSVLFEQWFAYQSELSLRADEIALGFCLQQPWVDKVVVGVDSVDQFNRLVDIEKTGSTYPFVGFGIEDEALINPSNWNNL